MATREAQRLIKAARAGDPIARFRLGRLYLVGGEGLAANESAALNWLIRAWKAGHPDAARIIAEVKPSTITLDSEIRNEYFAACHEAANDGAASGYYSLGEANNDAGNTMEAITCFRRAADAGHARASYRLGEILLSREGLVDAHRWLERAIELGETDAAPLLAEVLWRQRDPQVATVLSPLAAKGNLDAIARLAEYQLLIATPPVLEHGLRWLRQAIAREHPRALLLMGRLHLRWLRPAWIEGLLPHSPRKAAAFLHNAATLGVAEAHWDLACLYARSGHRLFDLRQSGIHRDLAAQAGVQEAQLRVAERLIARGRHIDSYLQAGKWLQGLLSNPTDGELVGPASRLLDRIAARSVILSKDGESHTEGALEDLSLVRPRLAARLELSEKFGLSAREALFLNPAHADREWCLLVDLRAHFGKNAWRLIRIETESQRQSLELAIAVERPKLVPAVDTEDDWGFVGSFRARLRKLARVAAEAKINLKLFIQDWQAPD